jgi:L-threonylcarbamoyladenylate synthase
MRRVFVDPGAPQRDAIAEAAKWIRLGRVVAIPTDTLYGLAADPWQAAAVARVFAVKGRSAERAIPLIAADIEQVTRSIGPLAPLARRLADQFWPGPLTLLLPAPLALAPDVTGGTGAVGVRVPDERVARAIAAAVGAPITATSANISGEPATNDPELVERALGAAIDLLVDVGFTRGGSPSTIVDVTCPAATLVREGAVSWERIQACLAA